VLLKKLSDDDTGFGQGQGVPQKEGRSLFRPTTRTITQSSRLPTNDYTGMYKEQLYDRHIFKYPPYFRLIKITLKHRDFEKLKDGSVWLYQVMSQNLDLPVLGPEEPAIGRIRNEYIRTILIKIPQNQPLGSTKKTIQKILNSFETGIAIQTD
jgi:primosomal protein N' (replication factor Y)